MHILHVVGARPNFMKAAPVLRALAARGARQTLVHSGQHYDRNMSDEINRMVTDRLADVLFTPSEDGDFNLKNEGVAPENIKLVGNVMIDSLVQLLPVAKKGSRNALPDRYALVTLHRPSNVDDS